jgi:hypothetical protein
VVSRTGTQCAPLVLVSSPPPPHCFFFAQRLWAVGAFPAKQPCWSGGAYAWACACGAGANRPPFLPAALVLSGCCVSSLLCCVLCVVWCVWCSRRTDCHLQGVPLPFGDVLLRERKRTSQSGRTAPPLSVCRVAACSPISLSPLPFSHRRVPPPICACVVSSPSDGELNDVAGTLAGVRHAWSCDIIRGTRLAPFPRLKRASFVCVRFVFVSRLTFARRSGFAPLDSRAHRPRRQ